MMKQYGSSSGSECADSSDLESSRADNLSGQSPMEQSRQGQSPRLQSQNAAPVASSSATKVVKVEDSMVEKAPMKKKKKKKSNARRKAKKLAEVQAHAMLLKSRKAGQKRLDEVAKMVEARTAKAKQDEVDKQSAEVVQRNRRAALAHR